RASLPSFPTRRSSDLARILRSRGFSVWIDEVEMKLGDSLRQRIDEGLRTSTFGAVILSPSFFKKRWPQWELDGLADREMSSRTRSEEHTSELQSLRHL